MGAFPNSKIGFGSWFIQTVAYISIFPVSIIFLVLLNIIINAVDTGEVWTPGMFQAGIIMSSIKPILNLVGLVILAKLPTLVPEAIFQLKPSPFGKAIGEGSKPMGATASGIGMVGLSMGSAKIAQDFGYRPADQNNPEANKTTRGKIIAGTNEALQKFLFRKK